MNAQPIPLQHVTHPPLGSWPQTRRALGAGIWLLLLLRSWQAGPDPFVRGGASISAREIGTALGLSPRQARRDLNRLRRAGYLELQNTGRGFRIRLMDSGTF